MWFSPPWSPPLMYIPCLLRPSKDGHCELVPRTPSEWIVTTLLSRCVASFFRARLRGNLFKFRDGWQNYDLESTFKREVIREKGARNKILWLPREERTHFPPSHIWYLDTTTTPQAKGKLDLKEILFFFFVFFNIYLLIWLCWVLVVAHKIFYCGMWLSWPMQCGIFSSLARDQTHVPCIAGQILKYWNTREAPKEILL